MKRYLFLKLGLCILFCAGVKSRAQVLNKSAVRDEQRSPEFVEDADRKYSLKVYQGVMGKPGIDFPVLTYIPKTAFTCRGMKSGYYADLETSCQVFHICDEGRKVSFLCPNGTIFQQSDLICDWWYKVDCASSPALYEESAEQLYVETLKRKENRRIQLEKLKEERRNKNIEANDLPEKKTQLVSKSRNTNNRNVQSEAIKNNSRKNSQAEFHSKETQVLSETASFINTKYNQHKPQFQTFNNFASNKFEYTSPKSERTNAKSTTEKPRSGRNFDVGPTPIYYKNHRYNDNVLTTTQHTIYSPTVPTITVSRLSARKYVTQPIARTTERQSIGSIGSTVKPDGFYITRDFTTASPNTYSQKSFQNHRTEYYSSTPLPYSTPSSNFDTFLSGKTGEYNRKSFPSTIFTTPPTTTNKLNQPTINEFHSISTIFPTESFTSIKAESKSPILTKDESATEKLTKTTIEENVSTSKFNKFTYLPKPKNASTPEPTAPTPYGYYTTPAPITEHLNSMIKTLKELQEKNVSLNIDPSLGVRPGLNIPPSAGPNTLHSLAVYFATALDNIVSKNETEEHYETTPSPSTEEENTDYVSLLSRSTVEKYHSLFNEKKDDADDNKSEQVDHSTTNPDAGIGIHEILEQDIKHNDLESQQFGGLLTSTPRIRQLAQVFTQALSAYLDDPGTFKKVLEDIRPTEPPNQDSDVASTITTFSTSEYSPYTREDDEVLDFSDSDKSSTFPSTTPNPLSTILTHTEPYSKVTTDTPYPSNRQAKDYLPHSTLNPVAIHLNDELATVSTVPNVESTEENTSDSYFPLNDDNRLQNKFNSKPYGFGVEPENSAQLNTITEVSTQNNWTDSGININQTFDPIPPFTEDLLPPYEPARTQKSLNQNNEEYLQSAHSQSFVSHRNQLSNDYKTTTDNPEVTTSTNAPTTAQNEYTSTLRTSTVNSEEELSTKSPFDFRTTTENIISSTSSFTESTTQFDHTTESQSTSTDNVLKDHWSTSPIVAKLWQDTLLVDPLLINRNLDDSANDESNTTAATDSSESSTLSSISTTEYVDEGVIDIRFSTTEDPNEGQYSTYSTIPTIEETTTVTNLNVYSLINSSELEIASSQAHQIFGNLNVNQQDILMERMKEAESNSTVRRLILLLISTCDSSLNNNKTVQETRNSIIKALLDYTKDEKDILDTQPVTTANRSGKKLDTNDDKINITSDNANKDSIVAKVESPVKTLNVRNVDQDARALELLRSLYGLAAKWGKK